MMCRRLSVALVSLFVGSGAVHAQVGFHGGGGLAIPVGELADYADPGWIVAAGVNRPIGRLLSVDLTGFFGAVSHNDEENASTQMPGIGVGARYGAGFAMSKPYGAVTVGLLQHRYKSDQFEESTDTKPFVAVGGGMQGGLFGLFLFADTRVVAADGTSFISIVGGFAFGGGSGATASAR